MKKQHRILALSLIMVFILAFFTGCQPVPDSGTVSNKYPEVLKCINEARAKLGNGVVEENTAADLYAERLGAMYQEGSSSFGTIGKSYMEGTAVGRKDWKAFDCSLSFNAEPEKYLTSYIATRSDISIVGISVVTKDDLRYLVIVGY